MPCGGYVVRDEQVVDCNETLIELKHAEGERVGQGDTIASVYRSADALNATQQLETLRAQKEQLEYAKSASSDAATALRLDTDIREQIISVRAAYESGAYSSLDTLIPQLKTTVLKREYAYNGSDDLTAKLDELNAQITALSGAASGGTTRITAPVLGDLQRRGRRVRERADAGGARDDDALAAFVRRAAERFDHGGQAHSGQRVVLRRERERGGRRAPEGEQQADAPHGVGRRL